LQKYPLNTKVKFKILVIVSALVLVVTPFMIERSSIEQQLYLVLHIASVILGSFLSIVSILTYLDFRVQRLAMISVAFSAITVAELAPLVSYMIPFTDISYGTHSLIIHSLILVMLAFFVIGIFRTD
jgi:hypothetical protein